MPLFGPSGGGAGTVTSVGLSASGLLHNVSGSPITTAGTLALTLKTQIAGTLLAGPISGADAAPTMRALDPLDVPALDAAKIGSGTFADARLASGITGSKISGALTNATLATSALTGTIAASQLAVSSPTSGQLSGLATANLSASAGLVAGQIASVNPSALTGSGTVPLAGLSGLTTSQLAAGAGILGSQLDAAAAITSGQISALDAAKITSGTLPLARLSGITTSQLSASAGILGSQLDAAAAIASAQITSLAAAKLTGTNTLPDGVLSTNVPLLASANTFTAAQTISATLAGVLTQINNASTTGAGLVLGSTTVASAGAGLIAPALAATQAVPLTTRYGLVSIGSAPWDGSTTGKFVGSSNGTVLALNAASGYTGNLFDGQVNGSSKATISAAGDVVVNSIQTATYQNSSGLTIRTTADNGLHTITTNATNGATNASGVQVFLSVLPKIKQTSTAGYTGLLVNATETSTGSGTKLLADFQVGSVSKASIDDTGALAFSPATTTTAPSAGAAGALPATPATYFTVVLGGTSYKVAAY